MKVWTTGGGQQIERILGGRCNCYLISYEGRRLLVDTSRESFRQRLQSRLELRGIGRLSALVLTHTHFDHVENAAWLKEQFKMPIIVHAAEAALLAQGLNPVIRGTNPLSRLVAAAAAQADLDYSPAEPDILVGERYDLAGLGFNGYVVHTPGHTGGSMSVILDDEIALAGDTIVGLKRWVMPPFVEDQRLLMRSWGRLLETGCSLFLPAHGFECRRAELENQWWQKG